MNWQRTGRAAMAGTFVVIAGILIVMMLTGQAITSSGEPTDTGGRVALVALLLAALVPAFIRRVDIAIPRWLLWVAGAASLAITAALWALVEFGFDAVAWAAYGGMQVLRGRVNFNDMDWDVRWLACDLCEEWNPHYGPALAWANPLTGGLIDVGWVPFIGFAMATLSVLGAVWLMQRSGPRGALALAVAVVGPAWLLQQDRANLDGLVFLAMVAGGWLLTKRESLLTWSMFAGLIWVNGALKYYPFAVGLALLPALRLRRGWSVIAGFMVVSVGYMAVVWSDFQDSLRWNSDSIYVPWDFPAYGRLMLLERLGPLGDSTSLASPGSLLLILLVALAALWGFSWATTWRATPLVEASMALGGSAVFLTTIVVGGFGFMYKGVFLLPMVPLLSRPLAQSTSRIGLYTSLFSLITLVYAMTFAYASVLTTLAGATAAGIGLGAGLNVTWRLVRASRDRSSGQVRASASVSQASTASS